MSLRPGKDVPANQTNGVTKKAASLGMGASKPPGILPLISIGGGRLLGAALAYYGSGAEVMRNESFLKIVPWHMFAGLALTRLVHDISTQASIMLRGQAEVRWPDQAVYTTENGELVLMNSEGAAGRFNRAMRVCGNYTEYIAHLLVFYVVASLYYPNTALACLGCWLVGRLLYLLQYTADRTTQLRLPGFLLSNFIGMNTLECVMWTLAVVHYKAQL